MRKALRAALVAVLALALAAVVVVVALIELLAGLVLGVVCLVGVLVAYAGGFLQWCGQQWYQRGLRGFEALKRGGERLQALGKEWQAAAAQAERDPADGPITRQAENTRVISESEKATRMRPHVH